MNFKKLVLGLALVGAIATEADASLKQRLDVMEEAAVRALITDTRHRVIVAGVDGGVRQSIKNPQGATIVDDITEVANKLGGASPSLLGRADAVLAKIAPGQADVDAAADAVLAKIAPGQASVDAAADAVLAKIAPGQADVDAAVDAVLLQMRSAVERALVLNDGIRDTLAALREAMNHGDGVRTTNAINAARAVDNWEAGWADANVVAALALLSPLAQAYAVDAIAAGGFGGGHVGFDGLQAPHQAEQQAVYTAIQAFADPSVARVVAAYRADNVTDVIKVLYATA